MPDRNRQSVPVAKQIAELKGVPVEEIARETSANFEHLFGLTAGCPDEKS